MVLACSMPVIEKAQAGLHLPPLSSSPGVHVSPNLDEKALLLEVAAQLIKNSKEGLQMNTALVVVVQALLENLPRDHLEPLLPPLRNNNRKTLVLDLDGTLIGSSYPADACEKPAYSPDYIHQTKSIWLRPGVRAFLQAVRPFFEVVLFTAATEDWALRALEELDPTGTLFDHKLYRDACVAYPGWPYVKDLSRLGRDLSSTIIVDDCTLMFQAQPSNAIWVTPYDPCTGPRDDVLAQVLQLLMLLLLPAEDVRSCLQHLQGVCVAPTMATPLAASTHLPAVTAVEPFAGADAGAASLSMFNTDVDWSAHACIPSVAEMDSMGEFEDSEGASPMDAVLQAARALLQGGQTYEELLQLAGLSPIGNFAAEDTAGNALTTEQNYAHDLLFEGNAGSAGRAENASPTTAMAMPADSEKKADGDAKSAAAVSAVLAAVMSADRQAPITSTAKPSLPGRTHAQQAAKRRRSCSRERAARAAALSACGVQQLLTCQAVALYVAGPYLPKVVAMAITPQAA